MKIWIINHYATNQYVDCNGRHHCLSKYLVREGHEVTIFCASTIHNSHETVDLKGGLYTRVNSKDQVQYCFVKSSPYSGNGLSRIKNMIEFYKNVKKVCKKMLKNGDKPDVIIASSVHPLALVAGIELDRKYSIPCICEVRDLWPASIVAYSEKYSDNNMLIKLLYRGEKWIYKKARAIIFVDEGDYDYIVDKGWQDDVPRSKVCYISNGVDLEEYEKNKRQYVLVDKDLDNPNCFKVVYAGSIRKVNNLGTLLDAAKLIANKNIKIIIWGAGDELEVLKKRIIEEEISNVIFKGVVEKKYIASITTRADLNIVHNSSLPILKYGISFNKLFDYMAAGKPILCDFKSGYNPIISSGCGEDIDEITPLSIAQKIEFFAKLQREKYDGYCEMAEKAAEQYNYKNLSEKLIKVIKNTIDDNEE